VTARDVQLRGRLTLTVPEAGKLLGIGRDAAYAAAERGEINCIEVGRRKVVPTHSLLRQVGWPDELIAQALGVDPAPERTEPGCSQQPATATVHLLAQRSGDLHGAPAPAR
jgi:excisionase family DNA binding protein